MAVSELFPVLGAFEIPGRPTATGGTAFAALIPPFNGTSPPIVQTKPAKGYIHVKKVIYTTGATAHLIAFMRPLNYTTVSSAAAAAQAVINITKDPGIYSTNYAYSNLTATTFSVADHGIAANDYVAYQCADGSWVQDIVSSVSTLAITMTTNVPTAGVLAGALFYYFGVVTLKDPVTNQLPPQTTIAATQTRDASWASDDVGICHALHDGDPILFYSPNTTNAGIVEACMGFYGKI